MYQLDIQPEKVRETLKQHIQADGYDLVLDMEKSQGVYLFDSAHDRKILDFFTCFASMPVGYNHPGMVKDEAFRKNLLLAALTNPSNSDIYTRQYAEFLDTFARVGIPDYLPHAFFIAGGALAVENALKAAMDWKVQKNFQKGHLKEKGTKVIHFEKAFHGRSGYTMSLTNTLPDKTKWYARFNWPRISTPGIEFPYTDEGHEALLKKEKLALRQIKQAFKENQDDICAIIVEPILSEGGDIHLRIEFFEELRKLADENECLLVYDEVQTGVALTGKFWCHQHFGENARPDMIAFGKKMQVCGILAGPKIDEIETNVFRVPSRINSTWGGNLTDMVRSSKILQIIEEDHLCEKAADVGSYLHDQLLAISERSDKVTNVRGRGLLNAFDLPSASMRNEFIKKGLENQALFLGCGERTIRFRPSLIMQREHIDAGVEIIEKVLKVL
ncbi:MAG TPA: L-lysine 6-transaminase [Anseongella sp.]